MGTAVSTQDIDSTTKMITNVMSKSILDIQSSTSSYISSDQYVDINFAGARVNCPVKVSQDASVTVDIILNNTSDLVNRMANDLINRLDEKLTNDVKQKLNGLNLGSTSV